MLTRSKCRPVNVGWGDRYLGHIGLLIKNIRNALKANLPDWGFYLYCRCKFKRFFSISPGSSLVYMLKFTTFLKPHQLTKSSFCSSKLCHQQLCSTFCSLKKKGKCPMEKGDLWSLGELVILLIVRVFFLKTHKHVYSTFNFTCRSRFSFSRQRDFEQFSLINWNTHEKLLESSVSWTFTGKRGEHW